MCRTALSALTTILKLVMQWSDQHSLGCFKYRVNVFAFLEAGSQNCGSDVMLRLVIMQLTST